MINERFGFIKIPATATLLPMGLTFNEFYRLFGGKPLPIPKPHFITHEELQKEQLKINKGWE